MNNHKEIILNYNEFNEDNIIFIKPYAFYKVTKNMGIYYNKEIKEQIDESDESDKSEKSRKKEKSEKNKKDKKIKFKRQKIIIQTPKMMVPFGVKEFINKDKKSYQMTLSFAPISNLYNENEVKKYFMFMRKIDRVIEDTISDHLEEWALPKKIKYTKTLKKLSEDFPHMFSMNLPYDEKEGFLFNVYNESAIKSNIDILDRRCVISAIIELTDLRFNATEYRANWNVMQIRKFKPYSPIQEFFMSTCFIVDEDDPDDQAYAQIIETYQRKLQHKIPQIPTMQQYYTNAINQMHTNPSQTNQLQAYNQNYQISSISSIQTPVISVPAPPPPPPPKQSITKTSYIPPSEHELKNMLGKLKKTTMVEKIAPMGKVLDENICENICENIDENIDENICENISNKIDCVKNNLTDYSTDESEKATVDKPKSKRPSVNPIKKKSNNANSMTTISKKKSKRHVDKD